jgi:hypothetical protein
VRVRDTGLEAARRLLDDNDALRRLTNGLVGILHVCLKTRTCYNEATARGHCQNIGQPTVAA